jgi:phosphoglycerate dehydrogenase-like enzyme
MKPTAWLINTSRGPIVEEAALIEVLETRRIAGAAIDVFDAEPLPADHPFRKVDNVLMTPHIGYVTEELYRTFYGDAAASYRGVAQCQCPLNRVPLGAGRAPQPDVTHPGWTTMEVG